MLKQVQTLYIKFKWGFSFYMESFFLVFNDIDYPVKNN